LKSTFTIIINRIPKLKNYEKNKIYPAFTWAIIYSCNNDDDANASYPYAVRLTDAPGPYDNVDVQGVEVIGDGGKIVLLNVKKGIYNLLDF
jgi:hypothetical protein